MALTLDIISDPFVAEQAQVTETLHAIMDSVRSKDFDRLAAHHLHSPKFTKFDDFDPLERQDADTANRSEADGLGGVDNFRYRMDDLKVDVFGLVAIATFVFDYGFEVDGESMDLRARTTMVFVNDGAAWKIAHEHLSPFKSNP
jgi:ketosteroid isomerase-like protein